MGGSSNIKLVENGKRVDGRTPNELREIRMQVGIIPEADGSALVEWGGNKVICGVYGPRPCIPRHETNPNKAVIKCRYMMSPFCSLEEHGRSGPNRRSIELSKVIREVFENLILAEKFPATQINIYIDVLQANGGTRTTSITAASLALINAGIPMKDIVSAVAVGKADGQLLLDLNKAEDNFGQSDMPIALSRKKKDILLIQMDGLLTKDEIKTAIDMAKDASEKVNEKQAEALKQFYELGEQDLEL